MKSTAPTPDFADAFRILTQHLQQSFQSGNLVSIPKHVDQLFKSSAVPQDTDSKVLRPVAKVLDAGGNVMRLAPSGLVYVTSILLAFPSSLLQERILYTIMSTISSYTEAGNAAITLSRLLSEKIDAATVQARRGYIARKLLPRALAIVVNNERGLRLRRMAAQLATCLLHNNQAAAEVAVAHKECKDLSSMLATEEDYVLRMLVANVLRSLLYDGSVSPDILGITNHPVLKIRSFFGSERCDADWVTRMLDFLSELDMTRAFDQNLERVFRIHAVEFDENVYTSDSASVFAQVAETILFFVTTSSDSRNDDISIIEIPILNAVTITAQNNDMPPEGSVGHDPQATWYPVELGFSNDQGYRVCKGVKSAVDTSITIAFTNEEDAEEFQSRVSAQAKAAEGEEVRHFDITQLSARQQKHASHLVDLSYSSADEDEESPRAFSSVDSPLHKHQKSLQFLQTTVQDAFSDEIPSDVARVLATDAPSYLERIRSSQQEPVSHPQGIEGEYPPRNRQQGAGTEPADLDTIFQSPKPGNGLKTAGTTEKAEKPHLPIAKTRFSQAPAASDHSVTNSAHDPEAFDPSSLLKTPALPNDRPRSKRPTGPNGDLKEAAASKSNIGMARLAKATKSKALPKTAADSHSVLRQPPTKPPKTLGKTDTDVEWDLAGDEEEDDIELHDQTVQGRKRNATKKTEKDDGTAAKRRKTIAHPKSKSSTKVKAHPSTTKRAGQVNAKSIEERSDVTTLATTRGRRSQAAKSTKYVETSNSENDSDDDVNHEIHKSAQTDTLAQKTSEVRVKVVATTTRTNEVEATLRKSEAAAQHSEPPRQEQHTIEIPSSPSHRSLLNTKQKPVEIPYHVTLSIPNGIAGVALEGSEDPEQPQLSNDKDNEMNIRRDKFPTANFGDDEAAEDSYPQDAIAAAKATENVRESFGSTLKNMLLPSPIGHVPSFVASVNAAKGASPKAISAKPSVMSPVPAIRNDPADGLTDEALAQKVRGKTQSHLKADTRLEAEVVQPCLLREDHERAESGFDRASDKNNEAEASVGVPDPRVFADLVGAKPNVSQHLYDNDEAVTLDDTAIPAADLQRQTPQRPKTPSPVGFDNPEAGTVHENQELGNAGKPPSLQDENDEQPPGLDRSQQEFKSHAGAVVESHDLVAVETSSVDHAQGSKRATPEKGDIHQYQNERRESLSTELKRTDKNARMVSADADGRQQQFFDVSKAINGRGRKQLENNALTTRTPARSRRTVQHGKDTPGPDTVSKRPSVVHFDRGGPANQGVHAMSSTARKSTGSIQAPPETAKHEIYKKRHSAPIITRARINDEFPSVAPGDLNAPSLANQVGLLGSFVQGNIDSAKADKSSKHVSQESKADENGSPFPMNDYGDSTQYHDNNATEASSSISGEGTNSSCNDEQDVSEYQDQGASEYEESEEASSPPAHTLIPAQVARQASEQPGVQSPSYESVRSSSTKGRSDLGKDRKFQDRSSIGLNSEVDRLYPQASRVVNTQALRLTKSSTSQTKPKTVAKTVADNVDGATLSLGRGTESIARNPREANINLSQDLTAAVSIRDTKTVAFETISMPPPKTTTVKRKQSHDHSVKLATQHITGMSRPLLPVEQPDAMVLNHDTFVAPVRVRPGESHDEAECEAVSHIPAGTPISFTTRLGVSHEARARIQGSGAPVSMSDGDTTLINPSVPTRSKSPDVARFRAFRDGSILSERSTDDQEHPTVPAAADTSDQSQLLSVGRSESSVLLSQITSIADRLIFHLGEQEDDVRAKATGFDRGANLIVDTLTKSWSERLGHERHTLSASISEKRAALQATQVDLTERIQVYNETKIMHSLTLVAESLQGRKKGLLADVEALRTAAGS